MPGPADPRTSEPRVRPSPAVGEGGEERPFGLVTLIRDKGDVCPSDSARAGRGRGVGGKKRRQRRHPSPQPQPRRALGSMAPQSPARPAPQPHGASVLSANDVRLTDVLPPDTATSSPCFSPGRWFPIPRQSCQALSHSSQAGGAWQSFSLRLLAKIWPGTSTAPGWAQVQRV